MDFTGKVALLIGGTSGIGAATARALLGLGASVVVAGRDASHGEPFLSTVEPTGRIRFIEADVSSRADIERLLDTVMTNHGRLDFALNSAGYEGEFHALHEYPEADCRKVLEVNVLGVFRSLQAEVPAMIQTGAGSIVNLSSLAGIKGVAHASPYCASKHAVIGLTRSLALELAQRGIRVNALCPALVDTPMADRLAEKSGVTKDALAAMNPMRRSISAEEVARAAVWLFSDATASVTGQAIAIDGGLSAS